MFLCTLNKAVYVRGEVTSVMFYYFHFYKRKKKMEPNQILFTTKTLLCPHLVINKNIIVSTFSNKQKQIEHKYTLIYRSQDNPLIWPISDNLYLNSLLLKIQFTTALFQISRKIYRGELLEKNTMYKAYEGSHWTI